MAIVKKTKIKKSTVAVGAASGVFVYAASWIAGMLGVPEYTMEIASLLSSIVGIAAGMLQPKAIEAVGGN